MKIGIVGNRRGWSYEFVREKILEQGIGKDDLIISGGASGVDTYAQRIARELGAKILINYPDLSRPDSQRATLEWYKERYFARNKEVVEMCDLLIAFNIDGKPSGTLNTINVAKKLKKKVIVYEQESTVPTL